MYEVNAGGRDGKLMRHETEDRDEALRTAAMWARDHHSVRVIHWNGDAWVGVDWWNAERPPVKPVGNGRIIITIRYGPHLHTDEVGLEHARYWAVRRLAESGEIELPENEIESPDASRVDDATVLQVLADDIGANLDYEKLR